MNSSRRGRYLALLCLLPFAVFFVIFQVAPLAWVAIDFDSLDGYLGRLSSSRRKNIRRKLRFEQPELCQFPLQVVGHILDIGARGGEITGRCIGVEIAPTLERSTRRRRFHP